MELTLGTILILAIVFAGGAFLGVLLGRRSHTANTTVDRIKADFATQVARLQRKLDERQDS